MPRPPSDSAVQPPLTIYDVARAVGLSTSTVSNVLSGRGRTSAQTRAKVLATINEIGYRPNAVARSLRAQCTAVIGVVVGDLTDASNAELAGHIEHAAARAGYAVLLVSSDVAPSTEFGRVQTLIDHRADAIVFIAFSGSAEAVEAVPLTTPVVFASERSPFGPYVAVDDALGVQLGVTHLADLGHDRIGYVGLAHPEHQIDGVRHRAFERTLEARRIRVRKRSVLRVGLSGEAVPASARQTLLLRYLTRADRPTGVIASSDRAAFEVIEAAFTAGLGVPNDLSVVGWGNTLMARSPLIDLTSVAQPNAELARLAVEVATTPKDVRAASHVLEPWLEVRGSTGPVPTRV
jgi:LacI family transcriptional regulator